MGPMCSVVDPQWQTYFSSDSAESRGGFRLPCLDAVKLKTKDLARRFIRPLTLAASVLFQLDMRDTISTRADFLCLCNFSFFGRQWESCDFDE